jgi:hypothetical protein
MNTTQRLLDLKPPTMLRLSEIERILRRERLIVPPLSRRMLITLCDNGVFDTAPRVRTRDPYLVTEESFLRWVAGLSGGLKGRG